MNLQSMVVVALRLLALNLLFRGFLELSPKAFQLLKLYQSSSASQSPVETAVPYLVPLVIFTVALLLWLFALPVARFVTRELSEHVEIGALTLADCYSVAFVGFGLYYSLGSLPQVLAWSHFLLKEIASTSGDSWKEELTYEVLGVFIKFVLGLLLFVKGRKWALALASRHTEQFRPPATTASSSPGET
jgi:hypothetical protein